MWSAFFWNKPKHQKLRESKTPMHTYVYICLCDHTDHMTTSFIHAVFRVVKAWSSPFFFDHKMTTRTTPKLPENPHQI